MPDTNWKCTVSCWGGGQAPRWGLYLVDERSHEQARAHTHQHISDRFEIWFCDWKRLSVVLPCHRTLLEAVLGELGRFFECHCMKTQSRQRGKHGGSNSAPRKCCSLACPAASMKGRHLLLEGGGETKAGEESHHWSHMKTISKKRDPGVLHLCKSLKKNDGAYVSWKN